MPICTSCTHPTPYLYTVYQSAYNLRLEQCTACHAFADPYVEHDTLTLLLDLILLKRDVYRHLLFNRGLGARKAGGTGNINSGTPSAGQTQHQANKLGAADPDRTAAWSREKTRLWLIVRLGVALVTVDAFIRWTHFGSSPLFQESESNVIHWNPEAVEGFLRVFVGCLVETVAFHAGIVVACATVMKCLAWTRLSNLNKTSGIRQEFRYSHVPLTLLYSSLTKLFLLFLLSIWRPANTDQPTTSPELNFDHPALLSALQILDEDKLDREWVVRNVLGGMAAGFGLRVVLDCHPFITTTIVLGGWVAKTVVAGFISGWVGVGPGGNKESSGDMWLAYSIP